MNASELKNKIKNYWNAETCGTNITNANKFSKSYFEEIENYRYSIEPQIFSFAQFTRYHGKKVLEVGVGAGSDFLQWVRAGAIAHGIDLTAESIEHVKQRLDLYGLKAKELKVADAESLPYPEDYFDLVYSWGVIHHTPNTVKALEEMIRVTRPGGMCKIMVYNRHSLGAFYLWLKHALLKGRPWKSIAWCLHNFQESPGTKGYTVREFARILQNHSVKNVKILPLMTYFDTLQLSSNILLRIMAGISSYVFGRYRFGWFLTIEFIVSE